MTSSLFDLTNKTAILTGGSGVLGRAMAKGLLEAGATVCLIGRDLEKAQRVASSLSPDPARTLGLAADVNSRESLEAAAEAFSKRWNHIDILVNAAGGNRPGAITNPNQTFFDLDANELRLVMDTNLLGTFLPSQIFGKAMRDAGSGSIINISSMAAQRPLTRVSAYAAAKAGIDNFTRWLAVYMAREVSPQVRVNAIAPGFFLGEQNRAMLMDVSTNKPTPRGQLVLDHTPMARFGDPPDLVGTLVWLSSPAAVFVTGIVVPVDGGFSAFGGV